MTDSYLLPDLISRSAARKPKAIALSYGKKSMNYGLLQQSIANFIGGVIGFGLQRGERIAIYLEKRLETVIASFGATAAGCVFVPLPPLLKADQVGYILRDCNVRALITSPERLPLLTSVRPTCHDLRHVIVVNPDPLPVSGGSLTWLHWDDLLQAGVQSGHRVIDTDMAAILYTLGSPGKPKGFVLSHRNMVTGAKSVASHIENTADDTLLAALPPDEVDRRPDSIDKAIPNADILLLREDGSPCAANEPGELVHRGALVGMGYWNDHEKTAERYKPLPASTPGRDAGLVLPEIAPSSPATRCSGMRRVSSTSSVAVTK